MNPVRHDDRVVALQSDYPWRIAVGSAAAKQNAADGGSNVTSAAHAAAAKQAHKKEVQAVAAKGDQGDQGDEDKGVALQPGEWFFKPSGVAVSAADGTLFVTDEGGRPPANTGGGQARGRLCRLSRRGLLQYEPATREYTEVPNDYVCSRLRCPGLVRPTAVAIQQQIFAGPSLIELEASEFELNQEAAAATRIQARHRGNRDRATSCIRSSTPASTLEGGKTKTKQARPEVPRLNVTQATDGKAWNTLVGSNNSTSKGDGVGHGKQEAAKLFGGPVQWFVVDGDTHVVLGRPA